MPILQVIFSILIASGSPLSPCEDEILDSREMKVQLEVPNGAAHDGTQLRAFDVLHGCRGDIISAVVTTPPEVTKLDVVLEYVSVQGIAPISMKNISAKVPGVFELPLSHSAQSYVLKGNTMRVSLKSSAGSLQTSSQFLIHQ